MLSTKLWGEGTVGISGVEVVGRKVRVGNLGIFYCFSKTLTWVGFV